MEEYIADEDLISHSEFFEAAFPKYEVLIDEMTAEDKRVIIKACLKGTHLGNLGGIAATCKTVDFSFIVAYELKTIKSLATGCLPTR